MSSSKRASLTENTSLAILTNLSENLQAQIKARLEYPIEVYGKNSVKRIYSKKMYNQSKDKSILQFPAGATHFVYSFLKSKNIDVDYIPTHGRVPLENLQIVDSVRPRPELEKKFLPRIKTNGRGIFIIPPGVGKTRLMLTIAYNQYLRTGSPVLWVSSRDKAVNFGPEEDVNRLNKELSLDPSWLRRETRSSAANLLAKDELGKYKTLLIDEVQEFAEGQYSKLTESGIFSYIYGFTGTLVREDGCIDFILANVGPILETMTYKEAVDLGYIELPKIINHYINHSNLTYKVEKDVKLFYHKVDDKLIDLQQEFMTTPKSKKSKSVFNSLDCSNYLFKNFILSKERSHLILSHIKKAYDDGGNCIVLFDRLDYLQTLKTGAELIGLGEYKELVGTTKEKVALEALELFKEGKIRILFTTVGYKSLDLPGATDVFITTGVKSIELVLQAAGRLHRKTPEFIKKRDSHIHIYFDEGHPMLYSKGRKTLKALLPYGFEVEFETREAI